MKPWDGDRPQTPRIVLEKKDVVARGLSFTFATEQISTPTDWCSVDFGNHLMYVYRHGAMRSMQTLLDWGPSGRVPPGVGDIWWKPAGVACAALVHGDTAGYCEIAIPGPAIGDTALIPRIKYTNPLVHHLVEQIYGATGRDDVMARLLTDSAAETLRLLIIETHTEERPRKRPRPRVLDADTRSNIVEYLSDAVDSEITVDELARLADMPVSVFIKAFRQAFRTTPYQFLLDRRIDRAKALLLTTPRPVAEIARAVGFATPNHFATAFKSRVGVTPTAFRQTR